MLWSLLVLTVFVKCFILGDSLEHDFAAEWARWSAEVHTLNRDGVCKHVLSSGVEEGSPCPMNLQLSEKTLIDERCSRTATTLLQFVEGQRSAKAAVELAFGTKRQNKKKLLSSSTWKCFGDGMLAAIVSKDAVNGSWRRPEEISVATMKVEIVERDIKRWPMILKGMAPLLFRDSASKKFQSNEELLKLMPEQIELQNCFGDYQTSETKRWLHDDDLKHFKTANVKLQVNCATEEQKQSGCETLNPILPENTSSRLFDVKAFQSAAGLSAHDLYEVTMNWANQPGVRHTPFHADGMEVNIACQVAGKKSWMLMPYEGLFQFKTLQEFQAGGKIEETRYFEPFSGNATLSCFPGVQNTMPPPLHVIINENDCVTVPPMWLHSTESLGRSISLNMPIVAPNYLMDLARHWPLNQVYQGDTEVAKVSLKALFTQVEENYVRNEL